MLVLFFVNSENFLCIFLIDFLLPSISIRRKTNGNTFFFKKKKEKTKKISDEKLLFLLSAYMPILLAIFVIFFCIFYIYNKQLFGLIYVPHSSGNGFLFIIVLLYQPENIFLYVHRFESI